MCQLLVTFDCADTSILHILRNEKYQIYIKYGLFYVFSDEKSKVKYTNHADTLKLNIHFCHMTKNTLAYLERRDKKYDKCCNNCTICRLVMVEQILQFECTLF